MRFQVQFSGYLSTLILEYQLSKFMGYYNFSHNYLMLLCILLFSWFFFGVRASAVDDVCAFIFLMNFPLFFFFLSFLLVVMIALTFNLCYGSTFVLLNYFPVNLIFILYFNLTHWCFGCQQASQVSIQRQKILL